MLVEFSDFNLKLVILLIYPISMRIQHYTRQLYLENDNYFFYTFRYFACYTFAFIPLLIIQYRSKKGNKDIIDKEKKLKEENDKIKSQVLRPTTIELEKRKTKKIIYQNIIYIGLLCILGISTHLYRNKFEKNEYWDVKQSIGVILEIIDFIVLSFILLKQKFFKHHFIFIGIIAIVLLILFFISIPHLDKALIFKACVYFLFYSFFYGLFDVLGKRYMTKFYKSPYFLMFTIGIINSSLLFFYDVFAYFLNRDISGIIIGFQSNIQSVKYVFIFILDLFLQSIWNHGIWLTIYYFTPCHHFIPAYISAFLYYITNSIEGHGQNEMYSTVNIIIFSISNVINILCFLFFNEVLILNIFKLDYNTKKRIIERMRSETEKAQEDNRIFDAEEEEENEETENQSENSSLVISIDMASIKKRI